MSSSGYWGRGIRFPVSIDTSRGQLWGVAETSDENIINQSIHLILSTGIGERLMLPTFGSDLHKLIFEPLDGATYELMKLYTSAALERWEPRIQVVTVAIDESRLDQGYVGIAIAYRIKSTLAPGIYVYPFEVGAESMPLYPK